MKYTNLRDFEVAVIIVEGLFLGNVQLKLKGSAVSHPGHFQSLPSWPPLRTSLGKRVWHIVQRLYVRKSAHDDQCLWWVVPVYYTMRPGVFMATGSRYCGCIAVPHLVGLLIRLCSFPGPLRHPAEIFPFAG